MSQVALVTGGNRGIGYAIATHLQRQGFQVALTYRSGDPSALRDSGFFPVPCDVTDSESVEQAFTMVESHWGPVAVLVSNSGITRDGLLVRIDDTDVADVINTNLVGAIRVARRATKSMIKARYGRIIFISSVVGLTGSAGQTNYAASKAGLVGLARSLAREVGSRGITVNVVAPGFVTTDMTDELDERRKAEILGNIPLNRFARPEEVALAVGFLAGSESAYITGAVLPVDGGLGMGH